MKIDCRKIKLKKKKTRSITFLSDYKATTSTNKL